MGFLSLRLERLYGNKGFPSGFLVETDNPVNLGVQGMIFPYIHIVSGIVPGSPLSNDNISGNGFLAAKDLYA